MAKIKDFVQSIVFTRTNDNQHIEMRVKADYAALSATGDKAACDRQEVCVTGRFQWHGKLTLGAGWILWRNVHLLNTEEMVKAVKVARQVYARYSTSRDSTQFQDTAFWNMLEGKRRVRIGKGCYEWR